MRRIAVVCCVFAIAAAARAEGPGLPKLGGKRSPLGGIEKVFDLILKPIFKQGFGEISDQLGGAFKGLQGILDPKKLGDLLGKIPISVRELVKVVKSPGKLVGGLAKGILGKLTGVLQQVISLPDTLKEKVKELLFMKPPPESPLDTRNDERIKEWIRKQVGWVTGVLNMPIFSWVPKDALNWLRDKVAAVLALVVTPAIRMLQFVDGKIKAAIGLVIEGGLIGMSLIGEKLKKLKIPGFLTTAIKYGADLIGRVVGTLGSFVLKLSPQLESVVTSVVNSLADAAGALDEAMKAMSDTGLALSGGTLTPEDVAGNPVLQAALAEIKEPRNTPAYRAAERAVRVKLAQERYEKAFSVKRERVEAAVKKILGAISRALVSFLAPILDVVVALYKVVMGVVFVGVRAVVKEIIDLIPEGGGAVAAVVDVIISLVQPIIVDMLPQLVEQVALQVVGEVLDTFLPDLSYNVMKIWDDPQKRKMLENAQEFVKKIYGVFEGAKAGLDGLRDGLNKGVAAMLEGPVMTLLLRKLPPGLGELVATAVQAVLTKLTQAVQQKMSKSGGKLDITAMVLDVIEQVRPKLVSFMQQNLDKLGGPGELLGALVGGLDGAIGTLLQKYRQTRSLGKLFSGSVFRQVIAEGIRGGAPRAARFLAGMIEPCKEQVERGLAHVFTQVAGLVDKGNNAMALFRRGFAAIVPLLARFFGPPLRELFACGFQGEPYADFRAALEPALADLEGFFSEEGNAKRLLRGGLPGVLGLLLKVVSHPVGVLLARGMNDRALAGAIAGAIRSASDKLAAPGFVGKLVKGGLRGVLVEVARLAKGPIVAALARKLADEDFRGTLERSYDEVLAGIDAGALAQEGVGGMVRRVLHRWVQFALRKGIDRLGQAGAKVQRVLGDMFGEVLDRVRGLAGLPADLGSGLEGIARQATDAGRERFVTAARACVDKITPDLKASFRPAADCLVVAGMAAFALK